MPRLSRIALVLLLAAILSTTAVLAAPGPGAQPRKSMITSSTSIDLFSQLWSFLARVWNKNGSMIEPSGVQTKNGSMMEPDGNSLQNPVPVRSNGDNGSQVDPNG